MKVRLFLFSILVSLLTVSGFAQVYQRNASPFEFTRGLKSDTINVIPRGCDTVALPRMKYGAPTIGAIYFDTCANVLYARGSTGWVSIATNIDSTLYPVVIDSTGNSNYRVLFAVGGKIVGSSYFTYDSVRRTFTVPNANIDKLFLYDPASDYDLSLARPLIMDYDGTGSEVKIGLDLPIPDTTMNMASKYSVDTAKINIRNEMGGGDFVPYENATRKVQLTGFGLSTDHLDFKTTPTAADSTQRLSWDSAYGTLEVGLRGGNVKLQVGQEEVILVRNNTGSPLTDGQIVYITGSTGEVPTVALANNKNFVTASRTLGMVTEPIAHGAEGFVTITGIVNGLNTNALTEGAAIWLDSLNGAYTQTQPPAPYNEVLLGYVVKKAGGNGSIFIHAQNSLDTSYIRNQFNVREDKTAWVRKVRMDSLIAGTTNITGRINLAKDSIPITTSNVWGLTVDTTNGRVQRRTFAIMDSVAIVFRGTQRQHIVSRNTTSTGGSAGNVAGDTAHIVIGKEAGESLTTGYFNNFIGNRAGRLTTTGNFNTALGDRTLSTNISGSNNTALGYQSLQTATGTANTAVGYRALRQSTTGSNTAVGEDAGTTITTGTGNTGVGIKVFSGTGSPTLTTGSNNTAVGNAVMAFNNGSNNVGIGASALGSPGAASYSNVTAIGASAGARTASGNIHVGYQSGAGFSGENNIIIGNSINYTPTITNTFTGANNIAIGRHFTDTTGSNQLVIGSSTATWIRKGTGNNFLINAGATADVALTSSAALEINGTAGGILFPRMTTAQQNIIPSPATGLIIYNLDSISGGGLVQYNGTAWRRIGGGGGTDNLDYRTTTQINDSTITLNRPDGTRDTLLFASTTRPDYIVLPAGGTTAGTAPLKFTTQAAGLTNVEQGAMELIGNSLQFTQQVKRRGVMMSQNVITSSTTIGNTTTESGDLIAAEHGANYLEVGKKEDITLTGVIQQTSVGGGTLSIRVKYAGTTLLTTTTASGNIAAGTPFEIRISTTCRSIGPTGTMQINFRFVIDGVTNVPDSRTLAIINTTTSQDTTVTAQWSVANASNTITIDQGDVTCIETNK